VVGSNRAPARRAALIAGVLAAGVLVRLLFAALIPLFPDEAYYWEWSRRLAAGYFDHPPAIPLLIRAGTALLGASVLGVRLFAVLAGLVAAAATAAIALRLAGVDAALRAAIVITCLPLAAAGLVLATPDAPLLAATALGVYALVRAVQSPPRSRESIIWWIATGAALGLAFCSKYTSILLPVGTTVAVVSRASLRRRLREPGPYVACIVATLIFLPVLVWNAHHEWISLGFQLRHGLGTPRADPLAPLKRLGDLIGGQAGLVSPILFVLFGAATVRGLRRDASEAAYVLAVVAASTFLFFCYSATRQRVEANWPAPAYIPAIALLAAQDWSAGSPSRGRWWLRAGIWLGAAMSVLIYLHAAFGVLPIPARKDPLARSAGWRELAARAEAARLATADAHTGASWLGADRYQDAAELAFCSPSHPSTFAMNLSGRGNQYDLWPGFPDVARAGDALVVVVDETPDVHGTVARLAPHFTSVTRGDVVDLRTRRGVVSQRRLWILSGWRGGWPQQGGPMRLR
jgi:4-amino-4-deoxy-L-arabinose transferase-like glycosyltransferase